MTTTAPSAPAATTTGTDVKAMPQMPFGKYTLSRLICGANPFNADSRRAG